MRVRVPDAVAVPALAAIMAMVIAAPVVRAPSDRVFGMDIVGRHHDPFTVMQQFERPIVFGLYSQPVTDLPGAMLARLTGPVAAYNWLVLLTFPLSAAAAYLLGRHLLLTPAGAAFAAIAYAFAPFHLAQAAYHPHIAQTQWVPLYLLALWRCLDRPSLVAVGCLGAATAAVALSNFYGGFIAAVITPVAIAAYWLAVRRRQPRPIRSLAITTASLGLIAAAGLAYLWYVGGAVIGHRASLAFPRDDLFRYSANWWSYLTPPVEHPVLGTIARGIWTAAGVGEGLLEQQVTVGLAVLLLGTVAVFRRLARDRETAARARVPVLVVVGMAAFVCSLSPEGTIGAFAVRRPSAVLYTVLPMFRSYARFGVVVQLMAALLAGIGVDRLRATGTRGAQALCVALTAMVAAEYAVSPLALWRDVLPTKAHRWVMQQPEGVHALDCTAVTRESASVPWLTRGRVTLLGDSIDDCSEPELPQKLAANGYTHLLVQRDTDEGESLARRPVLDGLHIVATFPHRQVFAVTARIPAIYIASMTGFSPREYDAQYSWRWMGVDAAWTVVNTGRGTIPATLHLELSADPAEPIELRLDGRPLQTVVVGPGRHVHLLGPLTLGPGSHVLAFHGAAAPTVPDEVAGNGDRRRLSFALGTWFWTLQDGQP